MKTLLEKLNKEELLDGLAKESPIDAVEILLNLGKDIPKNIIDMVTKGPDDFYARLKSGTSYRLKDAFRWIIYDNIKKVSDNTINTIANNSDFDDQFIYDLAHSLLHYKNKIPDIILKRLSNNPNYSYSIAYALTHKEKEIPEILWPAISKLPPESPVSYPASLERMKNSYIFAERLRFKEIEIPVGLKIALDGFLKVLNNKNVKIPDDLRKEMENYKKINESSVINEKLDKEELTGVIANNHDASWELIDMCIKNQFVIPEMVLNNYFKDHPIFSKKEIPSIGLHILINKWHLYAHNLLIKNIDIPEIVLKAVSKQIGLASDLIAKFIKAKKDVPEILIKSISSSPKDSYWVARYFIERDKEVPEILNQSIAKEPMLMQTYKQFLKEIEIKKEVKRAYASKEVNESAIVNEKLDKEELLKAAANDPFESFALAKKYVEKYKEPPEELVIGLTKRKKEEWTGSNYNHSVAYAMLAMDHDVKVPDYVLESILESEYDAYDYLVKMIKDKRIIPDNFLNAYFEKHYNPPEALEQKPIFGQDHGYSKDVEIWYDYTEILLNKNVEIPENVINAVSKSIYYSERLIDHLLYKKRDVPEILLKSVSLSPQYSYYSATHFTEYDREVPEILNQVIAKNPVYQDMYDGFLLERGKKKKINESVVINEKLDKNKLLGAIAKHLMQSWDMHPEDVVELFDKMGEELLKYGKMHPYDVKKLFIKIGKEPPYLGSPYFYESSIINEKLDKEQLKQTILKNSNATFNYAKKRFLSKEQDPPEEFINAIAQSPWESKKYIDITIHTKLKAPKVLIQSIMKDGLMSLNLLKTRYGIENNDFNLDFPSLESISDQDLLKSIIESNYLLFEAYKIFKTKGIKIPSILWESILSNPFASFDVAKVLLKNNESVPEAMIKSIASETKTAFVFAFDLLKKNIDLPEVLLKTLAENPDTNITELGHLNFNNLLITYGELKKDIPEILIDAATNKKWMGVELSNLCMEFAIKCIKIPDKILDVFIEKTPQYGITRHLGVISYDILIRYIEYAPVRLLDSVTTEEAFKIIPSKLYQYVITPDIAGVSRTKKLIQGFLSNFNKVPEDFKQTIIDNYEEFGHEIPKDIADSAGIKQTKTINEKLEKDELLDAVIKDKYEVNQLVFNFAANDKKIPEKLVEYISQNWNPSYMYQIAIDIIRYSNYDVPEMILRGIAKSNSLSNEMALLYKNHYLEIPDVIMNALTPKQKEFYNSVWWSEQKPIEEKLDKGGLLGVIQKDYDGFIQIMDFYFRNKKEYPPEEFLKMATETDEASRIFAEYCLEHKKDIPDEVIKKVAENSRSAYTIAALMVLEKRKVPKILLKSIDRDPLNKKHFNNFLSAKGEDHRFFVPTSYYAKI